MYFYKYDGLNRLIRENIVGGNTTVFKYDDGGNLQFKKIYSYSSASGKTVTELLNGTFGKTVDYTYTFSTNGDLMTSYNGSGVLWYDNCGLPVQWFKHEANCSSLKYILQWYDLRLTAVTDTDTGEMYYYKYNDQGIRTEKKVDGVTHKYYLQGEKIIAEKIGEEYLKFYYDATGVCGFNYNGTDYYYLKNIFGDILGIYDDSGNVCAEYSYDAWGRCTIKGHASDFAQMNPFRYRGYYYDRETGWYYLNSRYYDPEVGRFINADDISYIQPTDINGLNLFAYCGNNPVMYTDPSGCAWWYWFLGGLMVVGLAVVTAVTAGVAGAAIAGAAGFSSNGSDNINFGSLAIMTVSAGLDSALTAGSLFAGPTDIAAIWGGRVVLSGLTSIGYGFSEGNSSSEIALSLAMSLGVTATLGQGMFFSKPFSVALAIMAPFKALGTKLAVSFGKNFWYHGFSPLLEKIFR